MIEQPIPDMPAWIAQMLPQEYRRYGIDVGDHKIMHVMETGSGYPVLLLHGNPTWGFLYRRIMAQLAGANLRCIVPDLIGLGFSSKPERLDDHTLAKHAEWLGALIDQLQLEGLIFVGQDWGGPIGLRALADRPQLLRGLILLNTAITPPPPNFKPTPFHKFANMPLVSDIAFRLFQFPQIVLHRVQGDPTSIRGDVAAAYRYPLRQFKNRIAPLALARMVPTSHTHPSIAHLEKCQHLAESFQGPAEIVWGKKDPILGRLLRRMRQILPQAKVTETEAGHFLQEEVPELIAAAIVRVAEVIAASLEHNRP